MSQMLDLESVSLDSLHVDFVRFKHEKERSRLVIARPRNTQPLQIIHVIKGERAEQLYAELLGEEGGDADARAGLQGSIFSRVLQDL